MCFSAINVSSLGKIIGKVWTYDGKCEQLRSFIPRQIRLKCFNVGIEKCVSFGETVLHPENLKKE